MVDRRRTTFLLQSVRHLQSTPASWAGSFRRTMSPNFIRNSSLKRLSRTASVKPPRQPPCFARPAVGRPGLPVSLAQKGTTCGFTIETMAKEQPKCAARY